MIETITKRIVFETSTCTCGLTFALPDDYLKSCRANNKSWYCPQCRAAWSYDKSKEQILQSKLDQAETRIANEQQRTRNAQAEAETHKRCAAAQKGAKTRLKNRAAKGVCPCCNRSFTNLRRHMENKHPDFTKE